MIKVAPSILSADFAAMGENVENCEKWGADCIHFDVMDGSFVPAITFGHAMLRDIRKHTRLPIDVHLMTEHPSSFFKQFAEAGADMITFHVEAERHVHRALQLIKEAGVKAGVVLNPATPLCSVEDVLADCDMVLIMSVNPGAGGQKFIPNAVERIRKLRGMADSINPGLLIEVDGGVNPETALLCREAGADILVAGSSVFCSKEPADTIRRIRGGK